MVLLGFIAALLAAGGSELVLLFSAAGGLSGLAALVSVLINYQNGKRAADKEDKSVAIVELEKAVPGLGTIIKEWQAAFYQQQEDLKRKTDELVDVQKRLDEALANLDDCRSRITMLERERGL